MAGSAHLVGRASVEVQAGGVDGFLFQGEVAGWVHERLLPELESLLDSLPEVDGHVVLDRLDVVLDAGTSADWRDRAISALRAALMRELRRKMSETGDGGAERLTSSEAFLRAWMHYLEHGALPWSWILPDGPAMAARIDQWLDRIDSVPPDPSQAVSLARSLRTTDARRRLLALSAEQVERILALVFGIEPQATRRWARDLDRLEVRLAEGSEHGARPFPRGRRDLFEAVLAALAARPLPTSDEIEHDVERAVRERLEALPEAIARLAGSEFESQAFRALPRGTAIGLSARASGANPIEDVEDDGALPAASSPTESSSRKPSSPDRVDGLRRIADPTGSRVSEGFHIPNAGLVLVAPYLPLLFDRLDWHLPRPTGEGRVPGDQASALTLSHYLATGRDDPSEFELVLAKVLCGMEPEESFDGPVVLDARAREEADQLLESVLGHWGALKDTSIDGLREAFLRRPGKLSLRDGFWRLQVEQKPWDMLLEQLPWSLQFVKLPWMARTLKTEWME